MSIRPRPTLPPKWHDRLVRSRYFLGAVLLHMVVFLMIATLIIFKAPETPQENASFIMVPVKPKQERPQEKENGGGSLGSPVDQKLVVQPPSSPLRTMHTFLRIAFSLAPNPPLPSLNSAGMDPMSGNQLGVDASGPGRGPRPGNTPLGGPEGSNDLVGTLYDFTRNAKGDSVPPDSLKAIVQEFVANGAFQPAPGRPCFVLPKKIHTRQIFVPVIDDTVAGATFGSPQSSQAFWLVHYQATITPSTSGKFRFYGFGDNVLIVAVDGVVVLDASDRQYLGKRWSKQVGAMAITGPGKSFPTPIFSGDAFSLESAMRHRIDILIGDEGGVTTSGLFIKPEEMQSAPLAFSEVNGAPKIPLFVVGAMSAEDRQRISRDCPPEAMKTDLVFTGMGTNGN